MEPTQSFQELCIRLIDGHLPAHEEQGERIATALERIAEMMAHPFKEVRCSTETTTPKRVRNEAACCGNCPYRAKHLFTSGQSVCGVDSKTMHAGVIIHADDWCGQHPDFWREEA